MHRRALLLAGLVGVVSSRTARAAPAAPPAGALPRRSLTFPRDHGAHPELRTEWWYITGHAREAGAAGREFGFQVTFFRARPDAVAARPPGRFVDAGDLGPGLSRHRSARVASRRSAPGRTWP